jgi:hypothetical protein
MKSRIGLSTEASLIFLNPYRQMQGKCSYFKISLITLLFEAEKVVR